MSHKNSGSLIGLALAAALMNGGDFGYRVPKSPSWIKPPPKEPDPFSPEELAKGRCRITAAQARRDKREARRQADRERTARQQGRVL